MAALTAGTTFFNSKIFASTINDFTSMRPLPADRKFTSAAIEDVITKIKNSIHDKQLGWLFENCFPNTLDTTVDFEMINGKSDTYVITGDIDAMWLRDSSAQVWPYVPFAAKDEKLKNIPVIIYTTSTYKIDREITNKLGAAYFLTKPTDMNHLPGEIIKAINKVEEITGS